MLKRLLLSCVIIASLSDNNSSIVRSTEQLDFTECFFLPSIDGLYLGIIQSCHLRLSCFQKCQNGSSLSRVLPRLLIRCSTSSSLSDRLFLNKSGILFLNENIKCVIRMYFFTIMIFFFIISLRLTKREQYIKAI